MERDIPVKNIKFVQFGSLTAEEWMSISVEITVPYIRGGDITNTPYDLRLGALDNGTKCMTCGGDNQECDGHFGHIKLDEPVFNSEYFDTLYKVLKCVCPVCSTPRITKEHAELKGILKHRRSVRLKEFQKKCAEVTHCWGCHNPFPIFTEKNRVISMYFDDKNKSRVVSTTEIMGILKKIKTETCTLLGFNDGLSPNSIFFSDEVVTDEDRHHLHEIKPESFMTSVLPVIPPIARPWVMRDNEKRDDDITEKYNSILKIVNKLKSDKLGFADTASTASKPKKKGGKLSEVQKEKLRNALQLHVWTLADNTKEKSKLMGGGRTHKGFRERMEGKDGQVQLNVGGKRVNFSARSVIVGGGSLIPHGWIGMPEYIARKLSVPELVTPLNIEYLQGLVDNGHVRYVSRGGEFINMSTLKKASHKRFCIQERDIVERMFQTGDWGIFNRQPTLRIESMLGVQVIILKGEYAWRLPLSMTRVFNAD